LEWHTAGNPKFGRIIRKTATGFVREPIALDTEMTKNRSGSPEWIKDVWKRKNVDRAKGKQKAAKEVN
jgi:hypothetical protein